jgi:hypothetical protein
MQPMYYIGLEGSSCGRKVASSLVIPLYRYVASTYPFCLHLLRKLPGWVPVIPILKLIRKEPSMTQKTESAVLSPNLAPLHCQHRSASGRPFCRMAISDPATGLCFQHARNTKRTATPLTWPTVSSVTPRSSLPPSPSTTCSASSTNSSPATRSLLASLPSWPTPATCSSTLSRPSSANFTAQTRRVPPSSWTSTAPSRAEPQKPNRPRALYITKYLTGEGEEARF